MYYLMKKNRHKEAFITQAKVKHGGTCEQKIQKFYRPLDLSRENVNLFPPV